MTKRTTSAVWVKGIADMLAAKGLDVASLYASVGIDPAALEGPGARMVSEKISGRSRSSAPAIPRSRLPSPRWCGRQVSTWSATP